MTLNQILYQKINPADYLKLAEELSKRPEPSAKRTAADRAYYAAFLTSRDRLAEKKYITLHYSLDDHEYVATTLKDKNVLGNYGNEENRLRRARNNITYKTWDLTYKESDCPSVEWIIKTATEIIKRVEQLKQKNKG